MAAAGFIFGLNNQTPYTLGNGHASIGAIPYEEQSAGTNGSGVGWGQRLASRDYSNHPSEAFTTGSEVAQWNGGRQVLLSVSNGYSAASIAAGTHDAEWNSMWDRLFALPFGATDTSGAGTKKPLDVWFCYEHEVDRPDKKIPATDYVAAWKHIRVLRNNRAAAAGQDPSRVKMMTVFTAYGINVGRTAPYWPGNDQVDYFGIDSYNQLFGRGNWTNLSTNIAKGLTFNAAHGNKKVVIAETSTTIGSGTQSATQYWGNAATFCNAHPEIIAVFGFQGAPGGACNTDKVGAALTHEAMRQFIISTGGTAGYGTGSTPTVLAPSSPTGLTLTGTADGTGLTVTKGAPAAGTSTPTSYDVYIAPGNVTSGFTKVNPTPLAYASSFSYTITGLAPGTTYTVTMVAANAAGRSGFGEMKAAATAVPGSNNHAPVITAGATSVDPSDPNTITAAVTAYDPEGNPLTYTHRITGPQNFAVTVTGATVTQTFDQPGAYMDVVTVSDGTDSTLLTLRFAVSAGEGSTGHFNWPMPQPGDDLRNLPVLLRQIFPDIDEKLWTTTNGRSNTNLMHDYVASTFDPVYASGTSKTATAAGDLRWYKMIVQDSTVAGINTYVTDAQTGTGTVLCIHADNGSPLCGQQSGSVVDLALQSAGDTSIDLDTPITGLLPGSVVYLGWFTPSGVTPPKTFVATSIGAMSAVHQTAGAYRGNVLAGQSAYPDVLPLGSGSGVSAAFWALY